MTERYAIFEAIERKRVGRQWPNSYWADRPNKDTALIIAGFSSRKIEERVAAVVKKGTPELCLL
jgi:hypothetical protein